MPDIEFLAPVFAALFAIGSAVAMAAALRPPQDDVGQNRAHASTCDGDLDLATEIRRLLAELQPKPNAGTRIGLALQAGLSVGADKAAVRRILREAVAGTLRAEPGGEWLITLRRTPNAVVVAICTDDGTHLPPDLRQAAQACALLGGSMAVESWAGHGHTVTLRFPPPVAPRTDQAALTEAPIAQMVS